MLIKDMWKIEPPERLDILLGGTRNPWRTVGAPRKYRNKLEGFDILK